jgi:alpha-N-arabinofuranosidase
MRFGVLGQFHGFSQTFMTTKLMSSRQVEQDTKEHYAKKAHQWGKGKYQLLRHDANPSTKFANHAPALKLLDPSITLILCGKNGHSDWDRYVLQESMQWIDMHSIHMYTYGKE